MIDHIGELVVGAKTAPIDAPTFSKVRRCLLNHLGLVIGGSSNPTIRAMVAVCLQQCGTWVGQRDKMTAIDIARIYAAAANVYDYDDTHIPTVMHATSVVIPVVLGLNASIALTGDDFLRAILVGIEVAIYVGEQVSPYHYAQGWHITSTCGVFGAAAAAAYVLGLDRAGVRRAMGNALVSSSGAVQTLGTGAKSIGVGNAAANGIHAALFAKQGIGGAVDPFEGKFGFIDLYGSGKAVARADASVRRGWIIHDVLLKPYPCGIVLNPVVEAALRLRKIIKKRGIKPEDIAGVVVCGNPLLRIRTDRPRVSTLEMRQVSSQYIVPLALVVGRVGLKEMRSEKPIESVRNRLADLIEFVDTENASLEMAELIISIRDGESIRIQVDDAIGGSARPLTDGDVERKVIELCEFAGHESLANQLIMGAHSVEKKIAMEDLTKQLNPVVFDLRANRDKGGQS